MTNKRRAFTKEFKVGLFEFKSVKIDIEFEKYLTVWL